MKNEKTNQSESQIDLELAEQLTPEPVETGMVPQLNVNLPAQIPDEQKKDLISDEKLVKVYDEILDNIRKDREEIDYVLNNFVNMVINDGEATSSSKEALVNLIKIKSDTADKLSKVADLMTRIKLRDNNTFPKYMAVHQNNTTNITKKATLSTAEKRQMIEEQGRKTKEGGN